MRTFRSSARSARRVRARGGFTLIEAALATVIVGVGVVAMVEAQQSFIRSNLWSSHAATGTFLANEIRELTRNLPKHDPVTGLFLDDPGIGAPTLVGWGPEEGEVLIEDFDDLDDFDGLSFSFVGTDGLADLDLPGPVNAFGEVIPDIGPDGSIAEPDPESGAVAPMSGWTQTVLVQKVSPFDTGTVVPDAQTEPASGSFRGRDVDEYPLRVTVEVSYQAPFATESEVVARVTWIVP
ncbi:MAG: hypothetical protein DYG94_09455 [Leptolyngbya sp. PLA3]|nr:MAG: hypothetical protein EDM82_11875 [Cyanobacteria bacterium CYA]MCE7968956.1 hypothetical protein [Leptolyngbya sp. PL-A3]